MTNLGGRRIFASPGASEGLGRLHIFGMDVKSEPYATKLLQEPNSQWPSLASGAIRLMLKQSFRERSTAPKKPVHTAAMEASPNGGAWSPIVLHTTQFLHKPVPSDFGMNSATSSFFCLTILTVFGTVETSDWWRSGCAASSASSFAILSTNARHYMQNTDAATLFNDAIWPPSLTIQTPLPTKHVVGRRALPLVCLCGGQK